MPERGPTPHPWHPAFVHLPIGCWCLATTVDALAAIGGFPALPGLAPGALSAFLLWSGCASALPAMACGLFDVLRLPTPLQQSASLARHVAAMGIAWLAFVAAGVWRSRAGGFAMPPTAAMLLAEAAATAVLVAGGRAAARVVFVELAGAAAGAGREPRPGRGP